MLQYLYHQISNVPCLEMQDFQGPHLFFMRANAYKLKCPYRGELRISKHPQLLCQYFNEYQVGLSCPFVESDLQYAQIPKEDANDLFFPRFFPKASRFPWPN